MKTNYDLFNKAIETQDDDLLRALFVSFMETCAEKGFSAELTTTIALYLVGSADTGDLIGLFEMLKTGDDSKLKDIWESARKRLDIEVNASYRIM